MHQKSSVAILAEAPFRLNFVFPRNPPPRELDGQFSVEIMTIRKMTWFMGCKEKWVKIPSGESEFEF